jgi:hypothetical protein
MTTVCDTNFGFDPKNGGELLRRITAGGMLSASTKAAKASKKRKRDDVALADVAEDADAPPSAARRFSNQLTVEFLGTTGTKSIKIFNNGRLQITGCKTPKELFDVWLAVCSELSGERNKGLISIKTS